jgi:hypothetical protein
LHAHEFDPGFMPKPLGQGEGEGDELAVQLANHGKSLKKVLYWTLGLSVLFGVLGSVVDYYIMQSAVKNGVTQGLAQAQQNRTGY